mgnify:CR=1 FL=1
MIRELSLSLAFLSAAAAVSAADWPMLGGRPDRNMVAEAAALPDGWSWEEGGAGKNLRWTAPLGHVTYGAPVVSDGRVFIGTNLPEEDRRKGGVLKCFAEKDGRLLWEAVHEKLGDATEDDVSIGVCSTPCVAGGTVFYVSNRGELVARAVADGAERWKVDFRATFGVAPNQASASSPVVAGDRVIVGSDDGRLYIVSLADGTERWNYELGQPVQSSPAVVDGHIVIGCDDGSVYCFGSGPGR